MEILSKNIFKQKRLFHYNYMDLLTKEFNGFDKCIIV